MPKNMKEQIEKDKESMKEGIRFTNRVIEAILSLLEGSRGYAFSEEEIQDELCNKINDMTKANAEFYVKKFVFDWLNKGNIFNTERGKLIRRTTQGNKNYYYLE